MLRSLDLVRSFEVEGQHRILNSYLLKHHTIKRNSTRYVVKFLEHHTLEGRRRS